MFFCCLLTASGARRQVSVPWRSMPKGGLDLSCAKVPRQQTSIGFVADMSCSFMSQEHATDC